MLFLKLLILILCLSITILCLLAFIKDRKNKLKLAIKVFSDVYEIESLTSIRNIYKTNILNNTIRKELTKISPYVYNIYRNTLSFIESNDISYDSDHLRTYINRTIADIYVETYNKSDIVSQIIETSINYPNSDLVIEICYTNRFKYYEVKRSGRVSYLHIGNKNNRNTFGGRSDYLFSVIRDDIRMQSGIVSYTIKVIKNIKPCYPDE